MFQSDQWPIIIKLECASIITLLDLYEHSKFDVFVLGGPYVSRRIKIIFGFVPLIIKNINKSNARKFLNFINSFIFPIYSPSTADIHRMISLFFQHFFLCKNSIKKWFCLKKIVWPWNFIGFLQKSDEDSNPVIHTKKNEYTYESCICNKSMVWNETIQRRFTVQIQFRFDNFLDAKWPRSWR